MATGSTRVVAVIGDPVRHSLSPSILGAAFDGAELDWTCVAFEVGAGHGTRALEAMRTLGLAGLSVTMPHKADVARGVDVLTASAAALGAVNCVSWEGANLVGHNTDGAGLVRGLASDPGISLSGASVGVVGAGGAARSIIAAVRESGAERVVVVNRSRPAAEAAVELAPIVARLGDIGDLVDCDVVINATPVGMGPDTAMAVPREVLRSGQIVVDIVYHPLDTPLLNAARSEGAIAVDGLGMLLGQAELAFEIWTGMAAPTALMRAAATSALARGLNGPASII